jgi:NADH-quinone oxidoreductase subunit H
MMSLLLANDPLLSNDIGLDQLVVVLIKVLVAFTGLLVSVILMVWFERKIIADMQNRFGPNRAGPFGLFQTVADGMKLILKEDLIP